MADRGKILFLVGEKKAEDIMLRNFFGKLPADQQNKLAKSIKNNAPENLIILRGCHCLKILANNYFYKQFKKPNRSSLSLCKKFVKTIQFQG